MERIGVRALRERLSSYLERVERGERLAITARGRVVARLEPPSRADDELEQLMDEGVVLPPRRPGGLDGWRLPRGAASTIGTDAVEAMREERV